MLAALIHALEASVLLGSWTLVGVGCLPERARRAADPALVWASALALGAGLNAVALTILAMLHAFRPVPVFLLGIAGVLSAAWVVKRGLLPRPSGGQVSPNHKEGTRVVAVLLGLVLAMTFFATLAPPSSMDATVYHLRVPAEFARTGTWSRLEVLQSFQPLYVEMLFGEGLIVGGGVLAALVHWALGLGAIAAAAAWGRRLGGNPWWAALIFGATALYVWESTSAFIDLGLALFGGLAFYWATSTEDDRQSIILAGIYAGLAAGSKFTGLMVSVLAGAASLAAVWPDRRRGVRRLVIIGAISLVVALPWYARNAVLTGNPIYPLANPIFGLPAIVFSTVDYGHGKDLLHLLLSPFDLLVARPEIFDQGWSVGPAFLALIPIAIVTQRTRLAAIVAAGIAAWWLVWFYSSPQTRLLLPVLPMAAGLASVGARGLWLTGSRAVRLGVAAILAVAVAGSLGTAALAVKSTAKAVLGLESERQYLERNSWNYPAFEEIDRLLPADAKVAAIGPVNNLYYAKRSAVFLGFGERSAAELRAAGFTHELLAGSCPLHGVRAGRTTLAEGSYPLRASRLGGGEYARLCYRLAALDVHGPVP